MLLDAIHTRLALLSKSERKVAQAVLKNPQQAVVGRLGTLAKAAQVSEPTVIRFCRALGFDGWHEFKLKLAQSLALAPPGQEQQAAPTDLASDLISKICSRSINTLLDLRSSLDAKAIQRAIDILERSSKIELYGQGTSGIVAVDAQHKFFRSGVPTVAYSDPHIHSIAAALLEPGDTVMAISQRGSSTPLLHSVRLARQRGAEVIVLAPGGTPLAGLATVLVPIDIAANGDPYTPISGRLAHLVVIDILAVGLALRRGPEFRRKMQNAQQALEKIDMRLDSFLLHAEKTGKREAV